MFKVISLTLIFFFVFNDLSYSLDINPSRNNAATLSATSGFHPIINIETVKDRLVFTSDTLSGSSLNKFKENAGFVYLVHKIAKLLNDYGGKTSADILKTFFENDPAHIPVTNVNWNAAKKEGETLCLPYTDESTGKTFILRYQLPAGSTVSALLPIYRKNYFIGTENVFREMQEKERVHWARVTEDAQLLLVEELARSAGKEPEDLLWEDLYLRKLPQFGGKSLSGYANWINRTVPGDATSVQKVKAHLGIRIHGSLVLQFYVNSSGGVDFWGITTTGSKLAMMRELAAALNKKPVALDINDFRVHTSGFGNNNLRGLLDWAMKTFNCPDDKKKALDLLKKHVGLPLIDKNEILELFKKGRLFWANTTKAAKLYMVELLAQACGKAPGALSTNDFNRKKPPVFNGKSLGGLLNWAKMEFKCASLSEALTALKDHFGIASAQKPVLALSYHDPKKTRHILR